MSQIVIPIVATILLLLAAAVWVLTHLPRAEAGAGQTALAISNRGLPLSNARITVKLTDGTAAVIDAGRLPRGVSTIPLPESAPLSAVRSVIIEGDVLGLQINAVSDFRSALAETNAESPPHAHP